MTALIALAAALVLAVVALYPRMRIPASIGAGAATAISAVATLFGSTSTGDRHSVLLLIAIALAVIGGGTATTVVFGFVDRRAPAQEEPMEEAREVLRGGAWIGVLERFSLFLAIGAGWPEGTAVVLAIKGLGRYPELRASEQPGAAERFIIGTMVSAVWTVLCTYIAFV